LLSILAFETRLLSWQQKLLAQQALHGLRARDDLAQGMGEELGVRKVLLRCMQGKKVSAEKLMINANKTSRLF
jgi:uncharacterized protein YigA (DUF484 family)